MKYDEKTILKFVRENLGKLTVKQMSAQLGLKERRIARIVKSFERVPPKPALRANATAQGVAAPAFFSLWVILGLAATVFILYCNTFHAAFFFDDISSIVENYRIRSFERLSWYWESHPAVLIAYASYALNYKLAGLNSFSFHVTNTMIHFLNGVLVYFFVLTLGPAAMSRRGDPEPANPPGGEIKLIAAVSALIFLCHPLQTAAVTYLVQRNASLATFFYLSALTGYAYYRRGGSFFLYLVSWVACLLGMFTKQIAFTAPLSLLLYDVCFGRKQTRKDWFRTLGRLFPFFGIWFFVYLKIFHHAVATTGLATTAQETGTISRGEYFLTQWLVICTYLRLLCLPVGLNFDYDFPVQRDLSASTFAAGALLVSLFCAGVFFYRRGARALAFGIFWFFLTLSVESTFIPIRDVIFEHRVYLPMLGFAVAAGWVLWQLFSGRPRVFVAISGILIVLLGAGTYFRNRVWASELALWQDTVRKSPRKARPVNNLGVTYLERGDLDRAFECYQKAIELDPNYMDAYINLGDLFEKRRDYAKAIESYLKALTFGPKTSAPFENLGRAYGQLGRYEEALKYLDQAIEKNPDSVKAYAHRGTIYDRLNKIDNAIDAYLHALQIDPTYVFAIKTLGSLYGRKKDYPRSIFYLEKACEILPKDPEVRYQLGVSYLRNGQAEKSREQASFLSGLGKAELSEKLIRLAAQDSSAR